MWHCLVPPASNIFKSKNKLSTFLIMSSPSGITIESIYKKYNYPGKAKLYQLAKKEGLKVTMKQVGDFLNKQYVQQVFSKKVQRKPGHIVAFEPDSRIQMDLIDMSNFAKKNGGYNWIMLLIDIFSRKAYAYLMRNKTEENVMDVLQLFLKVHHPDIIISDNEAAFAGEAVQALMEKHNVASDMVEPQDHKALGIVDRAVQTIKNSIYKYMEEEDTTTYYKELPRIIEAFNATPNSGNLNIAPDDAESKESIEALQIYNNRKDVVNRKNHVSFEVGDIVRRRLKQNPFARSYDEKYSKEQFTIEDIHHGRAFLDNGDDVSLRFLLKVDKVDRPQKKSALTRAKQETKARKKLNREHLEIESKEFQNLPAARTRAQTKRTRAQKSANVNPLIEVGRVIRDYRRRK